MKYIVVYLIINMILCTALDISSKLDFGKTQTFSKLTAHSDAHKFLSSSDDVNGNVRTNEAFANIGVINSCTENCSDTEQNIHKNSIQTDVFVHVKTGIDINNRNKSILDDNPDVPVIVGSSGQNLKHNNDISRSLKPLSIQYPHLQANTHAGNVFNDINNSPSTEQQANVNLHPLSSVTLKMEEERTSGDHAIQLRIPHHESSYHRHYFGENPPQQIIWYPGTNEYKLKSPVKLTYRTTETPISTTENYRFVSRTICTCKNNRAAGLPWYPTKLNYDTVPHPQISDKLSPLE